MYQEEVDMAWRIRYAGYKAVFVPAAEVLHAHSASSTPFSSFKAYYTERNRIWLVFKNFPLSYILPSLYHAALRYLALAKGARSGKGAAGRFLEKSSFLGMVWVLFKAWFVGVLALPLFIPKRLRIQSLRKKNKITSKMVDSWFKRFGTTAERIALLK